MSTISNIHLVKAISELAIFLEFTNPDLLNEDAAVEAMEQLAAELQLMPEPARRQVSEQFRSISGAYDPEKRAFLESLPESLGLE